MLPLAAGCSLFGGGDWKSGVVETLKAEHDDFTLRWHAGPGVTAGYARDRGASGYGLVAGICGSIGVEFAFRVPVSISVSLMPALATHVRSENGTMKMYLYVNGLVQGLSPRLGIRWRF